MAKLIGYARVSTKAQDADRQVRDLLAAGVRRDDLYVDHGVSGARASRPGFNRALEALHEDDTLVITTLDRLGHGYGLGLAASQVSVIIGSYVFALLVGALLFPLAARRTTPRNTLVGAALLVGTGYALFLPFHDTLASALTNMVIAGLGSGALVAALPSAAAAAAPLNRTGMATGLTNTTKTIGGSFASAVFGIALASAAADALGGGAGVAATAAPLQGYLTVWGVCSATAFAAAAILLLVPRLAFADPPLAGASA